MPSGLTSWKNLLSYAFNAFSVPLLVGTLFAPWERDTDIKGNYSFFEKMVLAILSRTLGFVARVVFIIIGLLFTTVVFLTFPIFLLLPIKISREYLEGLGSFGAFLSYGNTYTLNVHSRELAGSPRVKLFGKEKNHLEIKFKNSKGKDVTAIAFFSTQEKFPVSLDSGNVINLVATLEKSTFRNFPELRLRIVDIF